MTISMPLEGVGWCSVGGRRLAFFLIFLVCSLIFLKKTLVLKITLIPLFPRALFGFKFLCYESISFSLQRLWQFCGKYLAPMRLSMSITCYNSRPGRWGRPLKSKNKKHEKTWVVKRRSTNTPLQLSAKNSAQIQSKFKRLAAAMNQLQFQVSKNQNTGVKFSNRNWSDYERCKETNQKRTYDYLYQFMLYI